MVVHKAGNGVAVSTGLLAYFKAIPWPEIAGFLSAVWLLIQIGSWVWKHRGAIRQFLRFRRDRQ